MQSSASLDRPPVTAPAAPALQGLRSRLRWILAAVPLLLAPAGQAGSGSALRGWHRYDFSQSHMGTVWTITCYSRDPVKASNAVAAAFSRVRELDRSMTDYDPESELNSILKHPVGRPVKVSRDMTRVLAAAAGVSRDSSGVFDVTAGNLIQAWRRARRQRELPDSDRISAATSLMGYSNVTVNLRRREVVIRQQGIRLDLGGIAKGYAADEALRLLRKRGIPRAVVAASGDLAIGDPPPGEAGWPVRIGDPSGSQSLTGVRVLLKNAGVSTSGDTEQFVEIAGVRYSHIVDPRTGFGVTNRVQASVVAESATRSDAWATAVCILGVEEGLRRIDRDPRLAAFILSRGGKGYQVHPSRRFPRSGAPRVEER